MAMKKESVKLNKRERKFISPAVKYGWNISEAPFYKNMYWDGDPTMPCKSPTGPTAKSLIEKGLLRWRKIGGLPREILITPFGESFKCRANGCDGGRIYPENYEDGEYPPDLLICAECFGTGVAEKSNKTTEA